MIVKFTSAWELIPKDSVLSVEMEMGLYLATQKVVEILDITDSEGVMMGQYGDFPIQGTAKVTAPAGFYFGSATAIGDTTMTAMETVGEVAYVADSYLNKNIPGVWHPFTAKVTAITLSSGELQAWLKPL